MEYYVWRLRVTGHDGQEPETLPASPQRPLICRTREERKVGRGLGIDTWGGPTLMGERHTLDHS